MLSNKKIRFLLSFLFISALFLTTCDTPLGMGDPIDWEPPVLTLSPKPPNPMYVKLGAQLTGTVTDNVAVDRVILRDSTTGELLFTAELLPNDRWQIKLDFSPEQNGETIQADVVAFDKMGNSGAESIATIMMTIDIRPPIVDDVWVQRTSIRTQDLLPYEDFQALALSDPRGEVSANVNKYQNGAFYISATISESETTIHGVVLKIYDSEFPDDELLSLSRDSGSSLFAPQWFLTEDMILNAGVSVLSLPNYKTDYKTLSNKRYYYRLRIVAIDKSGNESIEDQKYICLWNEADFPKGIIDTRAVGGSGASSDFTITKGSTIPIEFFDDDRIEWAYAALFTKEQWAGTTGTTNYIDLGVKLPIGSDEAKFAFLLDRFTASQPVYNWRYDRKNGIASATSEPVINLISLSGVDEKQYLIVTGNDSSDFGEFVLVTLVKDKKLPPHTGGVYPDVIKYKKYIINLVDENAPLIVFDKKGNPPTLPPSPEENTFPALTTDGNFTIHGYTLREDRSGVGANKVTKFRLAWIPFILATVDENILLVKNALEKGSDFPAGVQWWDLSTAVSGNGVYDDTLGDGTYYKQLFSKTFSILGGADIDKPAYNNFTYNGALENTTKLFVFYAEDNMGHTVFTQFYLLGNKTPPTIDIYDITDKLTMTYTNKDDANSPPSVYDYSTTGEITSEYIAARDIFNANKYPGLKNVSMSGITLTLTEREKTDTYRIYPRGTVVKLWAMAQKEGQLTITSLSMNDITSKDASVSVGYFKNTDYALGYVEYFPDVSQRVFLFEAEDSLGNKAKVQRTIAIASAAALTSITTARQSGTYPAWQKAGDEIEIRANFDGLINLQNNTNGKRPKLNVLYQIKDSGINKYGVQQIECEPVTADTMYLTFNFKVPANAQGKLETIYTGIANKPAYASHPSVFPAIPSQDVYDAIDRPITVDSSNKILDAVRKDSAYTPGNVTGFFWDTAAHSLQEQKNIQLDGIAPVIEGITMVNTKTAFEAGKWYLKSGESITLQITSSKPLKVKGDTVTALSFRLQRPNGSFSPPSGYDTTHFDYRKVTGANIFFTLDVNRTNIPNDGIMQNDITLVNAGNITDDAGNPVVVSSFTTSLSAFIAGKEIYFDLTPPVRPVTRLTGSTTIEVGSTPTTTIYYSATPYMAIANPGTDTEPYGTEKRQYSLDGGLNWVDFPSVINTTAQPWTSARTADTINILNGQWSLKTRLIDKAGNEGATTSQLIHVNNIFPKLLGINVIQPNATYIAGNTLNFTLDFDDIVTAETGQLTNITITLKDTTINTDTPGGISPTYRTNAISSAVAANSRTLNFTWTLASDTKDMLTGLMLDSIKLSGLKDRFGNTGPTSITVTDAANVRVTHNNPPPLPAAAYYDVTYDITGIKVSTIKPTVRSREPQNANNRTGNINNFSPDPESPSSTIASGSISSDNKTIKLNFSKPMQKGNGTITIRPHGSYAIPAVIENEGYYVTVNLSTGEETRSSTVVANNTYVSGFSDIFNNSSVTVANKTTLIGGTSMNTPPLSDVTGLTVGPYLKTTNGLIKGAGYSGYYGNSDSPTDAMPGINAPGPRGSNFMVPDVTAKWVLDYQYKNLFDTTGVVNNIRAVLDNAKWRWQEIAVTSGNVTTSGNSVTINLPEPLLPGLQWDVIYPDGTFTDQAGNAAVGVTKGSYWFWSKGVQKPVIRVERKSYDARISANYNKSSYGTNIYYNANGYNNGTITDFNTVNYAITSETPQARIFHGTLEGKNMSGGGKGSIIGRWDSTTPVPVADGTLGITADATILWQGTKAAATKYIGRWVRPNLIFRNRDTAGGNYTTMLESPVSQTVGNGFFGFRSYNKDATETDVQDITIGTTIPSAGAVTSLISFAPSTPGVPASSDYRNLEASKNYIAAIARIDHKTTASNGTNTFNTADYSSITGYEGVFRTVVMMYQAGRTGSDGNQTNITTGAHPLMISGSNVRNGLPTVAGFPLKDGTHRTDSRYVKFFYRGTNGAGDNGTVGGAYNRGNAESTQTIPTNHTNAFYWVTTEIVSSWYFQIIGRGDGTATSSTIGDVEDWMSGGYGDLSYALDLN